MSIFDDPTQQLAGCCTACCGQHVAWGVLQKARYYGTGGCQLRPLVHAASHALHGMRLSHMPSTSFGGQRPDLFFCQVLRLRHINDLTNLRMSSGKTATCVQRHELVDPASSLVASVWRCQGSFGPRTSCARSCVWKLGWFRSCRRGPV